ARNALEVQERKLYQLAVDHIWGVQTMPVLIAQYQKADSTEGLEKLLKRYAAYPTLIDQQIETLREGIADGRTSAAVPVRRAIERDKDTIARGLGHADRIALDAALADDPANHTNDPQELVRMAQAQTERAFAAAPRFFGRLPKADCKVVAVEEYRERESPPAFYMPPSIDGTRQAQYYLNTYQPHDR